MKKKQTIIKMELEVMFDIIELWIIDGVERF